VEHNASKISKARKVSTKTDEMRRIWEIEQNGFDPKSANRPNCAGPIGVEMYRQIYERTNSGLVNTPGMSDPKFDNYYSIVFNVLYLDL
jgi:hypothetical protein